MSFVRFCPPTRQMRKRSLLRRGNKDGLKEECYDIRKEVFLVLFERWGLGVESLRFGRVTVKLAEDECCLEGRGC